MNYEQSGYGDIKKTKVWEQRYDWRVASASKWAFAIRDGPHTPGDARNVRFWGPANTPERLPEGAS
jgi:hypothetical protein